MAKLVTFGRKKIKKIRQLVPRGRRTTRFRSIIPRRMLMIRKGRPRLMKLRPTTPRVFKRFRNPLGAIFYFTQPHPPPIFKQITRVWRSKRREWNPVQRRNDFLRNWWKGDPRQPVRGKRTPKSQGLRSRSIRRGGFDQSVVRKNEQRVTREDIIKTLLNKLRVKKKFAGRARIHKWTGTNMFGPTGHLGPLVIIDLKPTKMLAKTIKKLAEEKHVGINIKRAVQTSIDDFRDKLIAFGERFIDVYVPEETGRLKKSLKKNLRMGRRMGLRFKMKITTSRDNILKYAKPVNEMTNKMLQHPRINKNKTVTQVMSIRTGRLLNDPKAQHHFFNYLFLSLQKEAKKLLRAMVKQIVIMVSKTSPASVRRYRAGRRQDFFGYSLPRNPRSYTPKVDKKVDIGISNRIHDMNIMKGYIKENINFPDVIEGPGGLKRVLTDMEKELIGYKKELKALEPPFKYINVANWFEAKGLGRWK